MAVLVTDATFAEVVLAAPGPVLVDFQRPSSAPCRLVSPIVDALGEELGGRLTVVRVDVDESVVTAGRHGIFSLPTLVLFDGGRETERLVGYRPRAEIASRLLGHLDRA
jgi:thioredoxin-like negative regulator of GroEL